MQHYNIPLTQASGIYLTTVTGSRSLMKYYIQGNFRYYGLLGFRIESSVLFYVFWCGKIVTEGFHNHKYGFYLFKIIICLYVCRCVCVFIIKNLCNAYDKIWSQVLKQVPDQHNSCIYNRGVS